MDAKRTVVALIVSNVLYELYTNKEYLLSFKIPILGRRSNLTERIDIVSTLLTTLAIVIHTESAKPKLNKMQMYK